MIEMNVTISIQNSISEMRALAKAGQFDASYNHALQLLKIEALKNDPFFLLDLGVIQYFRGEYEESFGISNELVVLFPDSILALALTSMSGLYLKNEHDISLSSITRASEENKKGSYQHLYSSIFDITKDALEVMLLMALRRCGKYTEFFDLISVVMGIPSLKQGGKYLVCVS